MDKISPIKRRLLQYLELKGIAKTEFCQKTNISYANLKGKSLCSEIGGAQLSEILSVYKEISAHWLLTGEGNMMNDSVAPDSPATETQNERDNEMKKDSLSGIASKMTDLDVPSLSDTFSAMARRLSGKDNDTLEEAVRTLVKQLKDKDDEIKSKDDQIKKLIDIVVRNSGKGK